jgi:hypothetical protein
LTEIFVEFASKLGWKGILRINWDSKLVLKNRGKDSSIIYRNVILMSRKNVLIVTALEKLSVQNAKELVIQLATELNTVCMVD